MAGGWELTEMDYLVTVFPVYSTPTSLDTGSTGVAGRNLDEWDGLTEWTQTFEGSLQVTAWPWPCLVSSTSFTLCPLIEKKKKIQLLNPCPQYSPISSERRPCA